jgi:threonine dehydrogenase-like Zn-dependent dehydrogenase
MRGVRWGNDEVVVDHSVPEPTPAPGVGDIVLDVAAASICGSDLDFMRTQEPRVVLGHEFAGWFDGVPYAVEPTVFCGACEQCTQGHTNRCVGEHTNIGIYRDGGLADRVLIPRYALVTLPVGLDVRDASLVEPTSVSWHGVGRAAIEPGERVVVVGGGSIGLLAVGCVRHLGHDVALEARHPHQHAAGERLGATTPSGLYDVVIETAGSASGLVRSAELVRPGGRVVLLGNFQPVAPVPGAATLVKEITWIGASGRGRHDGGVRESDEVAAVLAADPDIPRTVITHRFPLADAREAFRVAADRASGAIKVVLEP